MNEIPYICLYDQLDRAFSSLQISGMKSVEHEDSEFNTDFSVDPLADPRLDKMDLFNMVDSDDRDVIANAQTSFDVGPADVSNVPTSTTSTDSSSESGSGE